MAPKTQRLWTAASPGKRWTELFFLTYSPFWIIWALGILVPFKLYEKLDEVGYMAICLAASVPCVLLPPLLTGNLEKGKPLAQQYWLKANVWIAIFSFIGNYFWTHYFYDLLGAEYTFPSWQLNKVPIPLYFMTHAYFCFYHALSNVVMRRTRHATAKYGSTAQNAATALLVFFLAYITAFMETLTIAHFPYYRFKDRSRMYTVGSLFYAIYFFVSFPAFYIMDESLRKWTLGRAASDSLAAGMLVTILLDFWRLAIGPLDKGPGLTGHLSGQSGSKLPWFWK